MWTIDEVLKINHFINIPSSRNLKPYLHIIYYYQFVFLEFCWSSEIHFAFGVFHHRFNSAECIFEHYTLFQPGMYKLFYER
jgi:hypothetical protein